MGTVPNHAIRHANAPAQSVHDRCRDIRYTRRIPTALPNHLNSRDTLLFPLTTRIGTKDRIPPGPLPSAAHLCSLHAQRRSARIERRPSTTSATVRSSHPKEHQGTSEPRLPRVLQQTGPACSIGESNQRRCCLSRSQSQNDRSLALPRIVPCSMSALCTTCGSHPSLTTAGRLISSSHPDDGLGGSTMRGADHLIPSLLSERAIDFLGRHESHMRNIPWSSRTQISKQVPYLPPRTGFPVIFPPTTRSSPRLDRGYSVEGLKGRDSCRAQPRKHHPTIHHFSPCRKSCSTAITHSSKVGKSSDTRLLPCKSGSLCASTRYEFQVFAFVKHETDLLEVIIPAVVPKPPAAIGVHGKRLIACIRIPASGCGPDNGVARVPNPAGNSIALIVRGQSARDRCRGTQCRRRNTTPSSG